MAKFEAHITCKRDDSEKVGQVGKYYEWKFSAFDADPLMGDKPYCYLTNYDPNAQTLLNSMNDVCDELKAIGVEVLRRKIERIIYDTKTGVNEIVWSSLSQ